MVATAPPASARSRLGDAKSSRNTCGASTVSGVSPEMTPEMTPAGSCTHLQACRGAEAEVHRASHRAHRQQRRGGAASGASDHNSCQDAYAHAPERHSGASVHLLHRPRGHSDKTEHRRGPAPAGGHTRRRGCVCSPLGGSALTTRHDSGVRCHVLKARGVLSETAVVFSKRKRIQERGGACSFDAATRATPAQLVAEELDDARQRLRVARAFKTRGWCSGRHEGNAPASRRRRRGRRGANGAQESPVRWSRTRAALCKPPPPQAPGGRVPSGHPACCSWQAARCERMSRAARQHSSKLRRTSSTARARSP